MITLLKFLSWFHAKVPASVSAFLGRLLGGLLYLILPGKRKLTREALSRSFPDWNAKQVQVITRKVFGRNGRQIAEVLRLNGEPAHNPLDDIECDPSELAMIKELVGNGRGGLFLTAHLNNYVYLAAWAARYFPTTVVVKNLKPPRLNEYADQLWNKLNIQVLHHHGTYRHILRAVTSGGVVGFIMDQNAVHSRGVFTTFFDRPACTTPGLAMLSAQSGVPVVPAFMFREGGKYRIKIFPAIPAPPDRTDDTLQLFAQRYTTEIEKAIRQQPEAWIWMHKRWKTQPRPGDRILRADETAYVA